MGFATTALRISAGPIVWVLHFATVYGVTALACARGFAATVPWVVGLASLAAVALSLLVIARAWPQRAVFESWLAATLAALGIVGIVFAAIPMLVLTPCA